jgi:NADPH:quinone reductase-like Zn-dependent oxidoreductase
MKAVSQSELGGPEVLTLVDVARPEPGLGQVLVRVHAAGVNPVDAINRQSGAFVGAPPFVLGWDVSGTVAAVGPGVTLYQPGDDVFGMLPFPGGHGGYAEYVVGPTRVFVPKPATLDHIHAAALPLAGLTAWQALVDTAAISQGGRVLITAAAGGVGHLAVQIAKAFGAYVIGLARPDAVEYVRTLGADEVIDYTAGTFREMLTPVDIVFDLVGHDYPAVALQLLDAGGILVSTLPHTLPPIAADAAQRGVRLAGLFVEADRLGMTGLADLVIRGQLMPTVGATFPLGEAGAAQSSPPRRGKTVLTVA